MDSDMFLGTGWGPWPSLDAVNFAPQAGQLPALAALAPSHQNPVVGSLQNNTAPSFAQHPPVTAALNRKRKAPTLRDSDWEPMKARITQLYMDDNLTIRLLRDALVREFQFQATERQILSRIQKWKLDKNVKKAEYLFMSRKLKHRRTHEPEKPDYVFRVRGTVQPVEKYERWERRMDANQVVFSPCSVPETPRDVSYKTPEGSGPTASPPASPHPTVTGFSVPIRSPIHFPTSPFAPAPAGFISVAQLDGRNFPSSPFPTPSPFISTPRLEAANFQGAGSAASPAASTPGLVADTGFEGASPAPWNDAAHEAICAIEGSGLTADGPPDTGFVYLEQKSYALERELYALERLHGKNNPEALRLMAELVLVLKDQGRYKSAERFGRRRFLAHRDRGEAKKEAWALGALADVFRCQGNLKKAAMTATKAYDMARTGSSRNERLAFRAQELLGYIFLEDRQPERGEEILVGLLGQVDPVLGIDNCHVQPNIMAALTISAVQLGKLRQAEEWAVKAMELCNQLNTKSDLSCCYAPTVLADIWIRQARYDEALKIGLKCIAACQKRYGLEHPKTAICMRIVGGAYTGQGQWNQAESCIKAAIDVRRRILGPGHSQVGRALIDRLYLHVEQQLWDQAEAVLAEYRSTGASYWFVSVLESAIIDERGRHSQALEIGQAPAQQLEATNDPDASYANNVIVKILRNLGKLEESEDLASRNIDFSTSLLGPKHPRTLQSVDNVARAKMAKGEAARAIQIMEECVQSLTASVGSEHYLTRRSRETLDQWMEMGGQYSVLPEVTPMEFEVWLAL
ncbi:hypothetical protein B0T18DRAFT_415896 [Schizothecium vesticola]|uniref:Clr5 domain-containing protein n=1 Tax=Schizothecium vesticola TaxID=314040 RepID=A0AA40EQS4_9PEZI|nr:hypothetical protein B0T18DRAFT_415896 [Schizothecium vesticola]